MASALTIDLVSGSEASDVTYHSESSGLGSGPESTEVSSHFYEDEQTSAQDFDPKDKASVIKHQLLAHYSAQTSTATFATSGTCPDAVNPCLSVTDIGTVGLPLSDRDAKAIVGASHQAPYGRGTETFVDTSVRKTWEINADRFQTRNPAWPKFLETILKKVSDELGVIGGPAAIEARPYKMLLYEEGALFKPHKDSEKEDRMFGTLVICLPSKHTGGAVHARLGQATKAFETEKTADFDTSYIAWYADVTHEVKPVTSGYRFVLTYNLIYTAAGTIQTAANLGNESTRLREILTLWMTYFKNSDSTTPNMLALMLKHKYTDACLKLDLLKGRDRHFVRLLADACAKEGFSVYLANLEKMVEGGCDDDEYADVHEIIDVCEEELYLTTMVDLQGALIGERLNLDEDVIVQKDPFRDPDEEDYSGYTGNEGTSATHFYRNTVVIMMPTTYRLDFLLQEALEGRVDVKPWIERLLQESDQDPKSQIEYELGALCDLVLSNKGRRKEPRGLDIYGKRRYDDAEFSEDVMGMVIKAGFRLKRPDLLQRVVSVFNRQLPMWVYQEIGMGLRLLPFSEDVQKLTENTLEEFPYLHLRHKALASIMLGVESAQGDIDSATLSSVKDWVKMMTEVILESVMVTGSEDAEALTKILEDYPIGALSDKAVACAVGNLSNTTFAVAFASALLRAGYGERMPKDRVSRILREILPGMINAFTLQAETPSKRQKLSHNNHPTTHLQTIAVQVDGEAIAYVLSQCMRLGLQSELDQLFSKLEAEAESADGFTLSAVVMPFLRHFLDLEQGQAVTDRLRNFVHRLVAAYIKKYVQMEPQMPRDWSRSPKGCGCADCHLLDTFLMDPYTESQGFAMAEPRRRHLHSQLSGGASAWLRHEFHQHGDFDIWTIREKSPYRICIRKTDREWRRLYGEWQARCEMASRQINALGEARLRRIFGAEGQATYDELVQLRVVKLEYAAIGH